MDSFLVSRGTPPCIIVCCGVCPCSCLLPEAWRGVVGGEGGDQHLSQGICGVFGGTGQRLGGGPRGGIREVGYRILGQVLRLGDCFRPPEAVSDGPGNDGKTNAI